MRGQRAWEVTHLVWSQVLVPWQAAAEAALPSFLEAPGVPRRAARPLPWGFSHFQTRHAFSPFQGYFCQAGGKMTGFGCGSALPCRPASANCEKRHTSYERNILKIQEKKQRNGRQGCSYDHARREGNLLESSKSAPIILTTVS